MLSIYLAMLETDEEKSLVEDLYKTHRQLMYKIAYRILKNENDAEDAVHEAFVRVIKNISKFSSYSRNENASYLVIVVKGISLDIISRCKKAKELEDEDEILDKENIEEKVETKLTYEEVKRNIEKLTPALQNIATLSFVKQLSAMEIAELLDMNINTVRSSVSRAKSILSALEESRNGQ